MKTRAGLPATMVMSKPLESCRLRGRMMRGETAGSGAVASGEQAQRRALASQVAIALDFDRR